MHSFRIHADGLQGSGRSCQSVSFGPWLRGRQMAESLQRLCLGLCCFRLPSRLRMAYPEWQKSWQPGEPKEVSYQARRFFPGVARAGGGSYCVTEKHRFFVCDGQWFQVLIVMEPWRGDDPAVVFGAVASSFWGDVRNLLGLSPTFTSLCFILGGKDHTTVNFPVCSKTIQPDIRSSLCISGATCLS